MRHLADLSVIPGAAAQCARPRRHPFLGGLLVKDRLINQSQLEQVLALQEQTVPRPLLGQLLVERRLITPHELNVVLGKYRREHLLGDILVETNLVTPAQLESALASQRRTDAPLGETLIELGYITERQLKQALSIQLRIAFVDLDHRSIDPGVTALISERYARHHRVIPIARIDGRIVLAMDDPTDVEVVAEVRSCTGHRIDVVTATDDALERAFSRLYGERGDVRSIHPSMIEAGQVAGRELEAKAQALTSLEMAHAALLQERAALVRSLCALQERHDALLRDRQFAIDRVGAALRRLRS